MLLLGVAFQSLQLVNRSQRTEFVALLRAPCGALVPIAAYLLLLGTVATTEEVFFRGILQRRWATLLNNEAGGLGAATIAFLLYHVPYAYLNPSWPSAGHFAAAIQLALANGAVTGLVLGTVHWRTGHNLLASIALHGPIDLIPASRVVHHLFRMAG